MLNDLVIYLKKAAPRAEKL